MTKGADFELELRDYQEVAINELARHVKAGARSILLCAPTGSGKTVIATRLMVGALRKNKRANFVVDRISLVDQTSAMFDRYGVTEHGVIQSQHPRFWPQKPIQVCAVQTLSRRAWPESDLDVIDEAHILHKAHKSRMGERARITLGLTATPFTKGLGKHFDAFVNVTTTSKLIEEGWLSPYRIFSCAEPNMDGVRVMSTGEWDTGETEKRALEVVGDVVHEYLQHGEGRKFICSAVDTAHCEELQRQFLAAGVNVATYTYKDRDEDRAETVVEFRRPDSSIIGLITVTAASRGFDVPDVSCIIMARPLRKSLAEHIQLLGRGLRQHEGKKDCIVLDHSGNCARFWGEMLDFFDFGLQHLDDGKPKEKKKDKPKERDPIKCPSCGHLHGPAPTCPACGHEYPRKRAVAHVPGSLKELIASGNRKQLTQTLWPQVCHYARSRRDDPSAASKMAKAIFKEMTRQWPTEDFDRTLPSPPTHEVRNRILMHQIAYAKARSGAVGGP